MTTFNTLENTTPEDITGIFNLSFSDYIIPFRLTTDQLNERIKSEGIELDLSVGAFENNRLVGFILHGYDTPDKTKTAYNGGTGVAPDKRGNKLTAKLYEFSLPILKARQIEKVRLEVITENIPALKTYKNIGFDIVRKLDCYKGALNTGGMTQGAEIKSLDIADWETLRSFWDWKPAWSNSIRAVEHLSRTNVSIGIYIDEKITGYLIFNPNTKRVQQFAIDKNHRNKGLGKQLFSHIAQKYGNEISLINIDDRFENTSKFLTSIGLSRHLSQYEMELGLL